VQSAAPENGGATAAVRTQRRGEPGPRRWGVHDPGRPHARSCRNKSHGTKAGEQGHTSAASSPHSETRRHRTSTRTGKSSRGRDFECWGAHGRGSGARITCTTTSRHDSQIADTEGATPGRDATAFPAAWPWPWYARVRSGQDTRAQAQEEVNRDSKAGNPELKARHDARLTERRCIEGCPLVRRIEGRPGVNLPRTPDIAAWGSHDAGSPPVRRGTTVVHGGPAAHGAQRLDGMLTGKSKEWKQHEGGQGCGSSHVGSAM
jgi:hypothetical protein